MKLRIAVLHTVVFFLALCLYGQTTPAIPTPVAPPEMPEIKRPDLEAYFSARAARLKAIRATATPGIVDAEIENSWLTYHLGMAGDEADALVPGFRPGDTLLDDQLAAFAALSVAPREQMEAKLLRLGVHLSDVYRPASGPYFTNGKGLLWSAKEHRFVLSVRGVDDAAANRCFKAAVDLSNGDVIAKASVACTIE